MKLLIIRHGESQADILNVHEGRADFPLTDRGHRQATAMAQYIKQYHSISAIYCSPLKRALQTAEHLADTVGVELCQKEMLMEFNNGLIAGLTRQEATEKYPIVQNLPVHKAVYQQESVLEFRFRADYILSEIISENNADSSIAIVTHGGMINQLYRSFLRLPVESDIFFCTGDTGVHEWRITDKGRFIVFSNYTGHCADI